MQKKLDIFANIAIILVALLIGFSLIRQQITHAKAANKALAASASMENSLVPGNYLPPPEGYQWAQHDRTLMVALRYGCIHCEHNMQLYQHIQNQIQRSNARTSLLSIFPDDLFVAQHDLDSHSLGNMPFLANINFAKMRVAGTPTLLLVDNKGTILYSWIGELSQREQDGVMKTIQ
jgi:hypothetical protein